MLERIIAPGQYIREANLIDRAGSFCRLLGEKAFIIGGKISLEIVEVKLKESLQQENIQVTSSNWYGGECSWENINQLAKKAQAEGAQFIIGVGGGKAIDTAKAAAYEAQLPLVSIPTIAATCAPWTPLSAVYSPEGVYLELSKKAQNPSLVLVDSKVIAEAPPALLKAGIGDTLAKWFESEISSRQVYHNAAVISALGIGKLCYNSLLEYGVKACTSAEAKEVTPALEQIIDANIMLSGLVSGLGGEDCRTGAAHSIYNGLTILNVHQRYHGEIVAYGILCQLVLDKKENELHNLLPFYYETGLPMTLAELGITSMSPKEEEAVGKASAEVEDMANMPFTVTWEMVIAALYRVNELGEEYLKKVGK